MSFQATTWAAKQATGSPGAKLTLLALANYADADGTCWPSQQTLAEDTEQSIDTVQRRIKTLVDLSLVRVEKLERGRGRWSGRRYVLQMGVAEKTKPQSAARSDVAVRAADCSVTMPQSSAVSPCRTAVRHKQSIEQSTEHLRAHASISADERLQAFQRRHEGSEVVQHRIAQRIGPAGWLLLGEMSDVARARLTTLERRGALDDATLAAAVRSAQAAGRQGGGAAKVCKSQGP